MFLLQVEFAVLGRLSVILFMTEDHFFFSKLFVLAIPQDTHPSCFSVHMFARRLVDSLLEVALGY